MFSHWFLQHCFEPAVSCKLIIFFSFYLQGLNVLLCAFNRASLGWFAYEPEWYDINNITFAQSEAQSVSIFVQYLSNERVDSLQSESKKGVRENGSSSGDAVR